MSQTHEAFLREALDLAKQTKLPIHIETAKSLLREHLQNLDPTRIDRGIQGEEELTELEILEWKTPAAPPSSS